MISKGSGNNCLKIHELPSDSRLKLHKYASEKAAYILGLGDEPEKPDFDDVESGAIIRLKMGGKELGFMGSLISGPVIETINYAVYLALSEDPRHDIRFFSGELEVDLWLLGEPRIISTPDQLSPEDGVIVSNGLNRAVQLPRICCDGPGNLGVLEAACVAADLHPEAWMWPDTRITAFRVESFP